MSERCVVIAGTKPVRKKPLIFPRFSSLFRRFPSLAMGGVLLLAGPCIDAQMQAHEVSPAAGKKPYQFDVTIVKPSLSAGWSVEYTVNGFSSSGTTLRTLVQEVYGTDKVKGGPAWVSTEPFDVQAKLDVSEVPDFRELSYPERRRMVGELLADRFHLAAHTETHNVRGVGLQIAKVEPKLQKHVPEGAPESGVKGFDCSIGGRGPARGEILAKNCSIADLVQVLTLSGMQIIDQTGISGQYDFELRWTTEDQAISSESSRTATFPLLASALQQQLGLKLVPMEVPSEEIVIDHAERPGEN